VGPYYLTALVAILGPVRRVTSSAQISFPERTIGSAPKAGTKITVRTPTHVAGVLDFASGPVASLIQSFDVWAVEPTHLQIYGSEGTLKLPDPNTFGGPVLLCRAGEKAWTEVPLEFGYTENSRALGLADMASAMKAERAHRASGDLAYHVLEMMHALLDASREGRHIELTSSVERPEPLPQGMSDWEMDV
jgi:predicted dehydrogenase